MQLFRLVNALLANDPTTAKANLAIRRYSVLPLSNNSGVIGWVPNCDTLQKLVKDYREVPIDVDMFMQSRHRSLCLSPFHPLACWSAVAEHINGPREAAAVGHEGCGRGRRRKPKRKGRLRAPQYASKGKQTVHSSD